jgi:DNA-binding NarL/FixJ family response regulator
VSAKHDDFDLIVYHAHQTLLHDYNDVAKKGPIKDLLGIAPLIILSAVDNPQEILKALESGARGYIADGDH